LFGIAIVASVSEGQSRVKLTPVGNYHAHLMSLARGKLTADEPIPAVEVPGELARLLGEYQRTSKVGDDSAFAALFTEDALYPAGRSGWVRGRRAIRDNCCPGGDAQLRPQAFAMEDSTAYIVGTVTNAQEGSPEIARFILTFRRAKGQPWLISARLDEELKPSLPIPFTADELIAGLDSAGIRFEAVLSVAYWFGSPPSVM